MSILNYIEKIKRENESPRITAQEPRNMADGGRIGFAKAKLVKLDKANLKRLTDSTNELYDTYGKDVVDKAAKEWAEMSNKEKNRTRKIKIQT